MKQATKKILGNQFRKTALGVLFCLSLVSLVILLLRCDLLAQFGLEKKPPLDQSKPVPAKADVIKAWQKRQDAIKTFRFAWTEQQLHPKGWIPNPRFPQREWLNIPGLLKDRNYSVSKTLSVVGNKMRYSFELDRKEEADGVTVISPQGDNSGLGEGKHYLYVSMFDGQKGKVSASVFAGAPPPVITQTTTNIDAQNLDTRPILLAFRPLDAVMGHLLIDRAVTNQVRFYYKGKSTFFLEERRDPIGWKTLLSIEPERNFLVSRFQLPFEQRMIAQIDIEYLEDPKWGWIPSGWQIQQVLDDGSVRLLVEAKVTSYSINEPIKDEEFR